MGEARKGGVMRRGMGEVTRKRILEITTKIKGPLRGSLETKYSRSFLKYTGRQG